MNKLTLSLITVLVLGLAFSTNSYARDERSQFSIEDAMTTVDAEEILDQGYTFRFGEQPHGNVSQRFGNFMSNKKSNGFGKSDQQACGRAFLSAMLSFQDRIAKEGGNAVINIVSFYKRKEFSSDTVYECGAGNFAVGVTFKGDVVTLD